MPVSIDKLLAEPSYHNCSPLVQLISHANEAMVVVEGMEKMAVVDTGSQVFILTEGFHSEFGLKTFHWGFVASSGDRGYFNTTKGYVEANLLVPGLLWYNDNMLFLVISEYKYGERVPVEIGTLVIDHLVITMTVEDDSRIGMLGNRCT